MNDLFRMIEESKAITRLLIIIALYSAVMIGIGLGISKLF